MYILKPLPNVFRLTQSRDIVGLMKILQDPETVRPQSPNYPFLEKSARKRWHQYKEVRKSTMLALADLRATEAIPLLSQILLPRESGESKWAAEALGMIGDTRSTDTLIRAIKLSKLEEDNDGIFRRIPYVTLTRAFQTQY
jgi:HEAT repeat protein